MLKYLIPVLIISGLILPICASAFLDGPIVPCGREGQKNCTLCDFFRMAKNIIEFIRDLIVLIAPVFILAGGITILISTGSPDKVSLGKKIIFSAVIGVAIAFGAWLILGTFFNAVIGGSGFPWAWNEFHCK